MNYDESRKLSGIVMAKPIDFSALKMEYSGLPEIGTFFPRDQSKLEYRFYDSESENILILLHGSGWHGQYFHVMAQAISQAGIAKVYTPNLRGHGIAPQKRGDVNYIGQLEDDLVDFLAFARRHNPHAEKVVLGGHSSGGHSSGGHTSGGHSSGGKGAASSKGQGKGNPAAGQFGGGRDVDPDAERGAGYHGGSSLESRVLRGGSAKGKGGPGGRGGKPEGAGGGDDHDHDDSTHDDSTHDDSSSKGRKPPNAGKPAGVGGEDDHDH